MSKESMRKLYKTMIPYKYHFNTDLLVSLIEKHSHILCYYPMSNEPDILDFLFEKKKNLYFPKIINKEMNFYRVENKENFIKGHFDIMEPVSTDKLSIFDNLLVFCPGLFFTKTGERLGHGKGYYDKFLSKLHNPIKIGLCYNYYIVKHLEKENHDICMDYVFDGKELWEIK